MDSLGPVKELGGLIRGKHDALEDIQRIARLANISSVRQGQPLGLGHAVLVTRHLVGDEPFGVILPDDVIDAEPPALAQMIKVFEEVNGPVILVERVPKDRVSSYGVIGFKTIRDGVYQVTDLVEKPSLDKAPSDLAIIGRYILTPDIFPSLEATGRDHGGEIQLTNGLRHLLGRRQIFACEVTGVRHDTGNKLGFLKATAYFAMKRPELAKQLRAYLASLEPKA